MKSSAGKIQVTSFQDLFQTGGGAEPDDKTLREIPLSELFPFRNHPFQVRDDEAMQKTVESIARSGVLSPGIVRPRPEGGYEIIAGHSFGHWTMMKQRSSWSIPTFSERKSCPARKPLLIK